MGIKAPQFELWRVLAAVALFNLACGLAVAGWRASGMQTDVLWMGALSCLGAAVGTPFRYGVFGGVAFACASPMFLGFVSRMVL